MKIRVGQFSLKELSINDYLDVYEYSKFPNGYIGPFKNPDLCKDYLKGYFRTLDFRLPKSYAIVNKQSKVIGQIDCHTYINRDGLELGFILHEDYRGKGIMQKALKKVIEDIFINTNFITINVSHKEVNEKSKNVIEACDFHLIDKSIVDGTIIYNYSINKIDFERGILKWQ